MKFVEQYAELWSVFPGNYFTAFENIERAGRVCYQSISGTNTSVGFVKRLIEGGHHSVLEHVNFVFVIGDCNFDIAAASLKIPAILINCKNQFNGFNVTTDFEKERIIISGNLRSISEAGLEGLKNAMIAYFGEKSWDSEGDKLFKYLYWGGTRYTPFKCHVIDKLPDDATSDEKLFHTYYTFNIVTDRGISHELVRHRLCSFSQESTRYVHYKEMEFINVGKYLEGAYDENRVLGGEIDCLYGHIENVYMNMLKDGLKPQTARMVLPNNLKTQLIMTSSLNNWRHIVEQRSSKFAHPMMQDLVKMIDSQLPQIV